MKSTCGTKSTMPGPSFTLQAHAEVELNTFICWANKGHDKLLSPLQVYTGEHLCVSQKTTGQ